MPPFRHPWHSLQPDLRQPWYMLAYRHAFHAGNHADVFKHIVLVSILEHMNLKDKAYRVIDTHAGAGSYALDEASASKTGEYRHGIARLWQREDLPEAVARYRQLVQRSNDSERLRHYPGSPQLAQMMMRPGDELRLFELHPTDHAALQALFAASRGVLVQRADGFEALRGQLPPPSRRALVLMDPSYEGLADYERVLQAHREAMRRFGNGVYLLWYPQVQKPGAQHMVRELKRLAPGSWLHARLSVQALDVDGFGLAGSGVFIINPPFSLHAQLQALLPWLASALAQHGHPTHLLEQHAA